MRKFLGLIMMLTLLVALLSFLFPTLFGKEIVFGYIPENEVIITRWVERAPGSNSYYKESKIVVVIDNGNIIFATIDGDVEKYPGPGARLVLNKDTYPPAKGKKVFVKLFMVDGKASITKASLIPFEK